MFIDFTVLAIVSLALMALWALLVCIGKKKVFALFAAAHLLLYVDYLALGNHYNFEIAGIMLAISAVAAIIQLLRHKRVRYSKQLAMYLLISAVPVFLYLLVSVS